MPDLFRETGAGRCIRYISGGKFLQYPDEKPGFQIPWGKDIAIGKLTPDESHIETGSPERATGMGETNNHSSKDFDIEQANAMDQTTSNTITPKRREDGIILVDWYSTDDADNPLNWSSSKKLVVSLNIILYTFSVYAGSSIYTSSEIQVMQRFDIGVAKASLPLSMYVLGYGLGPMLFSPLSEVPVFGRNIPYLVTFALFVILSIPLGLVDNYAGLLVLRFLTGFMGSPCLATGAATMGDIYRLIYLPYGLMAWTAAQFSAPALGPMISGFAVPAKGWHWSMWEILWMAGPLFILMFLTLPETSADNILLHRARRLRKLTGNPNYKSQSEVNQSNLRLREVINDTLMVPFEIGMQNPGMLFTNVYSCVIYGIYYSYFEVFPLSYMGVYGFTIGETSLTYVSVVVGCIIGMIIYASYLHWYFNPAVARHGFPIQEARLVPALFATWFLPIGLFWFGWSVKPSVHWIVSVLGITSFACGGFVLFQCIFIYLPLSYPKYAASLYAANDLFRSSLAAGSIVFATPLYSNLGIGPGCSLLGGIMFGGVAGIYLLWWFGASLRAKSSLAVGYDPHRVKKNGDSGRSL